MRSVSEAYCPLGSEKLPVVATLCGGLELIWPAFVMAAEGAPEFLRAYDNGVMSLDSATRAVALAKRSVMEARDAAAAVKEAL